MAVERATEEASGCPLLAQAIGQGQAAHDVARANFH
jgi:hypothetical protein